MKITPSVKRKLLKRWITRKYDVRDLLSLEKIRNILGEKIVREWFYDSSYDDLYRDLLVYTQLFVRDLYIEIEEKNKAPAEVVKKCRRAFFKHRASFIKLEERFPFIKQASQIEKDYSHIVFLLDDVLSEYGRTQLNRPLIKYIYGLSMFYHGWTGKLAPSTSSSSFSELVSYCIESLRLDKIWPSGIVEGSDTLQEVIGDTIRRIPRHDGKRLI